MHHVRYCTTSKHCNIYLLTPLRQTNQSAMFIQNLLKYLEIQNLLDSDFRTKTFAKNRRIERI